MFSYGSKGLDTSLFRFYKNRVWNLFHKNTGLILCYETAYQKALSARHGGSRLQSQNFKRPRGADHEVNRFYKMTDFNLLNQNTGSVF